MELSRPRSFRQPAAPPRNRRKSAGARLAPALLAKFAALTIGMLLALLTPNPARAEFTVCNQTLDVVNLAVGRKIDGFFQTDGWWTVGANQCVNVIREKLSTSYVYVYATDVFGHAILNGSTEMCVDPRRFSIRKIDECWQRGHTAARFYEVDTVDQPRWTFFLAGSGS